MDAYVYEYAVPITFPASQETVFAALVEPEALRTWFAEAVEVEVRPGGAYRFWGKHTLGVPAKAAATQAITKLDPPRSLSFAWRLLDRDSEVTWTVAAESETEAKVTVRHEFASVPDGGRVKEMIDDLWRLHTGNLCFYVQGERRIFRPDFDDPSPVVRHQIEIAAPPHKVFQALVRPDYIKQWFPAPAPVVEPRIGGKYGFGFSFEQDGKTIEAPAMTILDYVENERLVITWPDWRGDTSVPDQQVAWTLEDLGGRTRLTLEHTGFVRTVDVSDYPFGWFEFIEKIGEVAAAIE